MHSSAELDDESFEYVQNGRSVRRAGVVPSIDAHMRLGVVKRRQFDVLGATAFVCSCVGAFCDLYRQDRVSTASAVADTIDDDTRVAEYLGENEFYTYPDFYTFQAAAEPVDYRWFDTWPDHKQVHIETDPEPVLSAINDRLSGFLDEISLDFVKREATPQLLMKISIQLHLAEFSLSNTVLLLEVFGVERV